jgi:hypothetical protein
MLSLLYLMTHKVFSIAALNSSSVIYLLMSIPRLTPIRMNLQCRRVISIKEPLSMPRCHGP